MSNTVNQLLLKGVWRIAHTAYQDRRTDGKTNRRTDTSTYPRPHLSIGVIHMSKTFSFFHQIDDTRLSYISINIFTYNRDVFGKWCHNRLFPIV